jgi:hypothetical protein
LIVLAILRGQHTESQRGESRAQSSDQTEQYVSQHKQTGTWLAVAAVLAVAFLHTRYSRAKTLTVSNGIGRRNKRVSRAGGVRKVRRGSADLHYFCKQRDFLHVHRLSTEKSCERWQGSMAAHGQDSSSFMHLR